MKNEIITYITEYMPISEELEKLILEHSSIKQIKKGTVLLEEGKVSNECFFILNNFNFV